MKIIVKMFFDPSFSRAITGIRELMGKGEGKLIKLGHVYCSFPQKRLQLHTVGEDQPTAHTIFRSGCIGLIRINV
jgi:hypothetical protein